MNNISNDDIGISFTELFGVIVKHIKLQVLVFSTVMLACILYIGLNKQPFKATTTIMVDSIRSLTAWEGQETGTRSMISELQLLTHQDTIRSVLETLDLSQYSRKDGTDYRDILLDNQKVKDLQEAIKISPISGTSSIIVSFENDNARFAQDFLEAIVPIFESSVLEYARNLLQKDLISITNQKQEMEISLATAELELEEFKKKVRIEGEFDIDEMIDSISSRYFQGNSSNTLSYLQIPNIDLLQKINTIIKESTLITNYLTQIKSIELSLASLHSAVKIIEKTQLSNENGGLNNLIIFMIGVFFGALLAFFSTFIIELFSDSIDDVKIVETALRNESSVISIIPKGNKGSALDIGILEDADSSVSSAYNHLASILLYSGKRKGYTISSLGYGENTSLIVMNVALYLARCGKRVLVVCTHPGETLYQDYFTKIKLHKDTADIVKMDSLDFNRNLMNLSDYIEKLFIQTIDIDPIDLSRLLYSQQFAEYIGHANNFFDLVLIDGPTFETSWNLVAVAKITDGIILNIRKSVGSRKKLKSLVHTLKLCQTPLLGVIFNDIAGKPTKNEMKEVIAFTKKMLAVLPEAESNT